MEKTLYNKKETEVLGIYVYTNEGNMVFEDKDKMQFEVPAKHLSAICNVSDISKPNFYYREEFTSKSID